MGLDIVSPSLRASAKNLCGSAAGAFSVAVAFFTLAYLSLTWAAGTYVSAAFWIGATALVSLLVWRLGSRRKQADALQKTIGRLEAELIAAQAKAEAAREAKSDFIATVSHEIRTPMNGIIGFTEVALAGDLDAELRSRLELLADSGRAMMALLNDLLDNAKIDAGRMEISPEPIDLEHRLRASVSMLVPLAAQKGVMLDIEVDETLPKWIECDPSRLRQIILNLVGNALKFTDKGRIAVIAKPNSDQSSFTIAVADTGIGIAADKLGRIFDKFTQADATIDRRFGGTGLGLPICAKLAGLLGGSITVESALGKGSTFTLTLPLIEASAPRRRRSDRKPRSRQVLKGTTANILLVEDNPLNQQVSQSLLRELGFAAELAENGEEALAMVQSAAASGIPYDIVLMDQQLPGIDGLESAQAIRTAGFDPATLPIVAVTANVSLEQAAACLEAGMQAHLAKPFNLEQLADVLGEWLHKPNETAPTGHSRKPSANLEEKFSKRKALALRTIDETVRSGAFEARSLDDLASQLHQIAGVASFFGEGDLGARCSELDERLRNAPGRLQVNDFEEVRTLLRA